MKQTIKSVFRTIAPQLAARVEAIRARRHSHRWLASQGVPDLNRRIIERLGRTVVAGPLAGLVLPTEIEGEHLGPFLLGTYEQELHPWLERVIESRPSLVLDIGAKFGYYAVGLARRLPDSDVVTYDTDPWAREVTRKVAEVNATKHVVVSGFCSSQTLVASLRPGAFVLSDCEGFEGELFGKLPPESLNGVIALVEMHEQFAPGVTQRVSASFSKSHSVESVSVGVRTPPDVDLSFLGPEDRQRAIHEYRGEQQWMLFTPRA